ncbi:M23 family metallopeptidase [Gammaproteobacteria bacterium]|jgi:murein DD-endopeptidase MepM/ murein hydrolase activator NlpD|nr:M23 family metallopeptidase [Gammaproteobacteria bacterium]MDB9946653.1 M23 family metallopeptidase [Gammaproteobacteria bacterium]
MILIKSSWIAILLICFLSLLGVLIIFDLGAASDIESIKEINEVQPISVFQLKENLTKDIHEVQSGENLSVIFEKYKITLNATYQIFRADKTGEIKNLQPGDRLEFSFLDSKIQSIKIVKSAFLEFEIIILPAIKITRIDKIPDLIQSFRSGIIESSFYLTGLKESIPESVIMDLAYIFGWDIDFIFDIRAGDKFRILYETAFIDGLKTDNGSILFAEFYSKQKKFTAVRFKGKNKKWDYFDAQGDSLEKAFLRAPLDFTYISSHFNPNRIHPILNKIRAHNGVDYAAKRGNPIRVTGDGVIESVGWKGGYGRTVVVRHGGDITTLYAHMEKYNSTLAIGSKVTQGQTIGYVGDSGLATAPHLHYEFRVGDKRTDPLKVSLPSALPLSQRLLADFQKLRIQYLEASNALLLRDPNAAAFE